LVALVIGPGGGVSAANDYPKVTIRASEFKFEMPSKIESGYVNVTMRNEGKEDHQAQFARLKSGKTAKEVLQAFDKQDLAAAFADVTFAGGPGVTPAGQSQTVILDLQPGKYLVVCFVAGPDGVPHVAKGMSKEVEVTARSGAAQTRPTADATVTLRDFKFELPKRITSSRQTLRVRNEGKEPHEFALLKLAPGVSTSQAKAMITAQPSATPEAQAAPAMASPAASPVAGAPFTSAGGTAAIAPGSSTWVDLHLKPGKYLAVCFVPDPKTGKPHVDLGMIAGFTVK
jgi:hypothetical protein